MKTAATWMKTAATSLTNTPRHIKIVWAAKNGRTTTSRTVSTRVSMDSFRTNCRPNTTRPWPEWTNTTSRPPVRTKIKLRFSILGSKTNKLTNSTRALSTHLPAETAQKASSNCNTKSMKNCDSSSTIRPKSKPKSSTEATPNAQSKNPRTNKNKSKDKSKNPTTKLFANHRTNPQIRQNKWQNKASTRCWS